jgi:general stress protein YciG
MMQLELPIEGKDSPTMIYGDIGHIEVTVGGQPLPNAVVEIAPRKPRGFAAMDPERVREISRKGGRAAHRAGTAHRFTSEEARAEGRGPEGRHRPSRPPRRREALAMMLRDRMAAAIEVSLDGFAVWLGVGMTGFIGYALAQHVSVADAIAITFAGMLVLRAVRRRGDP